MKLSHEQINQLRKEASDRQKAKEKVLKKEENNKVNITVEDLSKLFSEKTKDEARQNLKTSNVLLDKVEKIGENRVSDAIDRKLDSLKEEAAKLYFTKNRTKEQELQLKAIITELSRDDFIHKLAVETSGQLANSKLYKMVEVNAQFAKSKAVNAFLNPDKAIAKVIKSSQLYKRIDSVKQAVDKKVENVKNAVSKVKADMSKVIAPHLNALKTSMIGRLLKLDEEKEEKDDKKQNKLFEKIKKMVGPLAIIGFLLSPPGLALLMILGAFIKVKVWDGFLKPIWEGIKNVIDWIKDGIAQTIDFWKAAPAKIADWWTKTWDSIKGFFNKWVVDPINEKIVKPIRKIYSAVIGMYSKILGGIATILGKMSEASILGKHPFGFLAPVAKTYDVMSKGLKIASEFVDPDTDKPSESIPSTKPQVVPSKQSTLLNASADKQQRITELRKRQNQILTHIQHAVRPETKENLQKQWNSLQDAIDKLNAFAPSAMSVINNTNGAVINVEPQAMREEAFAW